MVVWICEKGGRWEDSTPIGKLMHDFSCTDASEEIANISGLPLDEVESLTDVCAASSGKKKSDF